MIGPKPIVQEIERSLKDLIKRDDLNELREEYLTLNFPHIFNRAVEMIFNSKAAGAKKKISKKDASKYQKVQYWFSHQDLENFFENQALNFLFRKYAPEIVLRGKVLVPGRNKKKILSVTKIAQKNKQYKDTIENLLIIANFFFVIAKAKQMKA